MEMSKLVMAKIDSSIKAAILKYLKLCDTDCVFQIEGRNIKAHKTILRAVSPYLDKVFLDQAEELAEEFVINLEGIKFEDFFDALNLIYNGETKIEETRLTTLSSTIELLQFSFSKFLVELPQQIDHNEISPIISRQNRLKPASTVAFEKKQDNKPESVVADTQEVSVDPSAREITTKFEMQTNIYRGSRIPFGEVHDNQLSLHDNEENQGSATVKKPKIQCQFCHFLLATVVILKQHEMRCKRTFHVLYTCGICKKEFVRPDSIKHHMSKSHNVELPFDIRPVAF